MFLSQARDLSVRARSGAIRVRVLAPEEKATGVFLHIHGGGCEHAVEQAQQSGELDDSLSAREITFELDSFAMAANWQYHMFGDRTVFDGARPATREQLESLRRRQAA